MFGLILNAKSAIFNFPPLVVSIRLRLLNHREYDSISVSAEAKEMAEAYYLEKVANETPDVRADRVAAVKEKLKDPNYLNDAVIKSAADKFLSAIGL